MAVSPPRPKGPPLNALRAFEASARLGGFKPAAQELSVTAGAIAQHVKALEDWVGSRLFERRAQGVHLTSLGQSVLNDYTEAFDRLAQATQKLRIHGAPGVVRVATLPAIAQLWLSSRLPQLRSRWPDLSVSVTAMEQPPNLAREDFDATLFFEDHPLDAGGLVLAEDRIFPVCAPDMGNGLHTVYDLNEQTLLLDTAWADDWAIWLNSVAAGRKITPIGPAYSLYALAIEEAANGAGILIGHECLIERQLKAGSLVAPFEQKVQLDRSLVLRTAPTAPMRPMLRAFIEGLAG